MLHPLDALRLYNQLYIFYNFTITASTKVACTILKTSLNQFNFFMSDSLYTDKYVSYCVFRPANGCSPCCSVVKIIFLTKKRFFSFSIKNRKKRKESTKNNKTNMHKKGVYKCVRLFFFPNCDRKRWKNLLYRCK